MTVRYFIKNKFGKYWSKPHKDFIDALKSTHFSNTEDAKREIERHWDDMYQQAPISVEEAYV